MRTVSNDPNSLMVKNDLSPMSAMIENKEKACNTLSKAIHDSLSVRNKWLLSLYSIESAITPDLLTSIDGEDKFKISVDKLYAALKGLNTIIDPCFGEGDQETQISLNALTDIVLTVDSLELETTLSDALIPLQVVSDMENKPEIYLPRHDLNKDGKIELGDSITALRFISASRPKSNTEKVLDLLSLGAYFIEDIQVKELVTSFKQLTPEEKANVVQVILADEYLKWNVRDLLQRYPYISEEDPGIGDIKEFVLIAVEQSGILMDSASPAVKANYDVATTLMASYDYDRIMRFVDATNFTTRQKTVLLFSRFSRYLVVNRPDLTVDNITEEEYKEMVGWALDWSDAFWGLVDNSRFSDKEYFELVRYSRNLATAMKYMDDTSRITDANYKNLVFHEDTDLKDVLRFVDKQKLTAQEYKGLVKMKVTADGAALEFVDTSFFTAEEYKEIVEIALADRGSNLKYVDGNKLGSQYYKEVILLVFEEKGFYSNCFLEYVDSSNLTYEDYQDVVWSSFVDNNVHNLAYVDVSKLTAADYKKMVLFAVGEKDGDTLRYVNIDKLPAPSDYKEVLLAAFTNQEPWRGTNLEVVDGTRLNDDDYKDVVLAAVKDNGYNLRYVDITRLTKKEYYQIVLAALGNNVRALEVVNSCHLEDEDYEKIMFDSVSQAGTLIKYLDIDRLSDKYKDIALAAVNSTENRAIEYVDSSRFDNSTYVEIVTAALNKNNSAWYYVDKDKLTAAQINFFESTYLNPS